MDIALASSAGDHAGDTDLPLLIEAARDLGHLAEIAIWDDPDVDWGRFDRVGIRSCWDYTTRREEFLAWCERIGDKLINAPRIIEWNSDKSYLGELTDAGVAVIPTIWNGSSREELGDHPSWVVKPTISSGAANTAHWTSAEAALTHLTELHAAGHRTMTQPYVASIDTVGEFANYFFAGEYSHTVRKPALLAENQIPASTASFPGGLSAAQADERVIEFSREVIKQARTITGTDIVQARVDVVLDDKGNPLVMELELVEPALFLSYAPEAARNWINAVALS